MCEQWKDIKDFEGLYQISNKGRIKSMRRTVRRMGYDKIVPEKIKKLDEKNEVNLCRSGQSFHRSVNVLMDSHWGGRLTQPKYHSQPKLTEDQVVDIYGRNGQEHVDDVAFEFDVSDSCIRDIWAGRSWIEVTEKLRAVS